MTRINQDCCQRATNFILSIAPRLSSLFNAGVKFTDLKQKSQKTPLNKTDETNKNCQGLHLLFQAADVGVKFMPTTEKSKQVQNLATVLAAATDGLRAWSEKKAINAKEQELGPLAHTTKELQDSKSNWTEGAIANAAFRCTDLANACGKPNGKLAAAADVVAVVADVHTTYVKTQQVWNVAMASVDARIDKHIDNKLLPMSRNISDLQTVTQYLVEQSLNTTQPPPAAFVTHNEHLKQLIAQRDFLEKSTLTSTDEAVQKSLDELNKAIHKATVPY